MGTVSIPSLSPSSLLLSRENQSDVAPPPSTPCRSIALRLLLPFSLPDVRALKVRRGGLRAFARGGADQQAVPPSLRIAVRPGPIPLAGA